MNIHFSADDWARIERDWSAWWAGELERPLVMIESEVLPAGTDQDVFHTYSGYVPSDFPLGMPAVEVIDQISWLH